MPSPTPTEAQIDKVREIAGENDYDLIADLVATRTDAQWARALQLITAWDTEYPAGEAIRLTGEVQINPHVDAGLDVRNRMRLLLGLPETRSTAVTGELGSFVLRNEFVF